MDDGDALARSRSRSQIPVWSTRADVGDSAICEDRDGRVD